MRLSLLKAKDQEKLRQQKDILILLGIAISVWLVYFWVNFSGLSAPDAMYYATIARNIVSGNGYHANLISPFNFIYLGANVFSPSVNPPLFPCILALLFKLVGVSAYASALGSGIFFIISIIPLYLLSNKLFGRFVAVITSAIFLLEPEMLKLSISGLTESTFMFFLLSAFLFLMLFLDNTKASYVLLTGVFMGFCKLTRFNAIVFIALITVALFLFAKEKRLRISIIFLFGVILTQIPELLRIFFVRTPSLAGGIINYGAIDGTEQYPLLAIARILDPITSWDYIRTYPKFFISKYFENIFFYYKNFFLMSNCIVTALFTVSLLSFKLNRTTRILSLIIGLSILTQIVLISYNIAIIRYFYIFIPFIILFGIGYFFTQIYQTNDSLAYKSFFFLLTLLFFLPTTNLYAVFLWKYGLLFKNYESKESIMIKQQSLIGDFIRQNTEKDDFIATDYPSIAWYADRKTLYLPISFSVLETIDLKYKKINAILLTSESDIKDVTKLTGVAKNLVEWKNILDNPPGGIGKYILFKQGDIRGEKFVFYKRDGS